MAATLTLIVEDHGPANVHLVLLVKDEDGIRTITITGIDGGPVVFPDIPGHCPTDTISVDLGAVPRMRLPLTVAVTNCAEEEETTVFDGVGAPGLPTDSPGPSIRLPCYATLCSDSTACTNAKSTARSVRNRLAALCENRDRIEREIREKLVAIAIAALMVQILGALAAVVVSVPFGWIAALIALAAIALLIYSIARWAIQHADLTRQLHSINSLIEEVRSEFDAAVAEVNENCCFDCVDVDLSYPC